MQSACWATNTEALHRCVGTEEGAFKRLPLSDWKNQFCVVRPLWLLLALLFFIAFSFGPGEAHASCSRKEKEASTRLASDDEGESAVDEVDSHAHRTPGEHWFRGGRKSNCEPTA